MRDLAPQVQFGDRRTGFYKTLEHCCAYRRSCGRNFDEILRTIDSLQLTDSHGIATPAHWRVGNEVIIPPSISDEEARERFPHGWHELKPYLRLTAIRAPETGAG